MLYRLLIMNALLFIPMLWNYYKEYKIIKYGCKAEIKITNVIFAGARQRAYEYFGRRRFPEFYAQYIVEYIYIDNEGNEQTGSYSIAGYKRALTPRMVYYHPVSPEQHVLDNGGIKGILIAFLIFNAICLALQLFVYICGQKEILK